MADKIVLIKLDVQEAGAEAQIVSLNQKLSQLTEGEKEYELVLKKIAIQEDRLSKIQAKRATIQSNVLKETQKTTKVLNKQSDATGSATAATMELSRVVSDAPYGIRGMANNITQLVSQLGSASVKAGGLTAALKLMWKSLMGPLGVVFAITAAVSALDYFYGANEKSTDGVKEAEEAAKDFSSSLMSLERVLTSAGISQGDYNNKIRQYIILKKEQAGLEKIMLETASKIEEKNKLIALSLSETERAEKQLIIARKKKLIQDNKIAKGELKGKAFLQQIDWAKEIETIQGNIAGDVKYRAKIEQDIVDITKDGLDIISDIEEKKKILARAEKGTLKYLKEEKAILEKKRELSKNPEKYKEQADDIERVQKAIEAIEGIKTKGKKDKLSFFKTPKELELDVKNNEKAILDFNAKIAQEQLKIEFNEELSTAKTEKEKNKIRQEYSAKRLLIQIENERKTLELKKKTELEIAKAKTKSHKDDLKKAHELYKYKIENDPDLKDRPEVKKELLKKAKDTYDIASSQAETELTDTLKGIEERYKPLFSLFSKLSIERVKALFGDPKNKDKEETDLERWTRYAEKAKAIISTITDFVDGEFNRQLTIEQNKTNALNNELNKRLLDENLSADEREGIQNKIAQNDEKLRLKQEKIEKKRFKMQKAANIATTLINTAVAAAGVMADAKGGFFARLSQAIPTIAFGLAQVATIARQKFQSSAGSSPALVGGGSSASSARAEPSFNIVGRSNENVLMSAIQSQFDQPLRAYVVARDVTNQQQLDGVISGAAGT